MALGGGRHGVYSNGQTGDSTQGIAKIWETITTTQQSISKA